MRLFEIIWIICDTQIDDYYRLFVGFIPGKFGVRDTHGVSRVFNRMHSEYRGINR